MRMQSGQIINIPKANAPVPGCTVSEQILQENGMSIFIFSLAAGTSISPECYDYHKVLLVQSGEMEVFTSNGTAWKLQAQECLVAPLTEPVGMRSIEGCVYVEIGLRKDNVMNEMIKAGEVFALKELLPYQEGKILNMDLSSNDRMEVRTDELRCSTGSQRACCARERALVFGTGW